MQWLPHTVIGASCGVVLAGVIGTNPVDADVSVLGLQLHVSTPVVLAAAAAFGALLPDLDRPGTFATRLPIIGPVMADLVQNFVLLLSAVRPVRNPFPDWTGGEGEYLLHRGPFHAPLMAPVVYLAIGFVPPVLLGLLALLLLLVDRFLGNAQVHVVLGLLASTLLSFARVPFVHPAVLLAIAVGFLSHLVADEPTRLGLPLLWPFVTDTIRLPERFSWRSGTRWIEWTLAATIALVVGVTHAGLLFHV